ncbi:cytochrome-c peroxidase [Archangium lansingense]|uniref:cytochrome-c peroxidase n=1 Tax=Archangium lansingense TaxID=2995310 RepID=UPI003B783B67
METAVACDGKLTGCNPPTVLNAGDSTWFMWDGRADRLWNQALLPLLNPVEMNSNASLLLARLSAEYEEEYRAIFGKLPSEETDDNQLLAHFGKAIAAYERALSTATTLHSTRTSSASCRRWRSARRRRTRPTWD